VGNGIDPEARGCVVHRERGQQHFLVFERRLGIVAALDVSAEKPRKVDALAGGAEGGVVHFESDGHTGDPGIGHLAGDGPFPDQVVEIIPGR
jgi:hypothetical protein